MSTNRDSSMQNGFIDPATLTFDLLTPKEHHFEYIPRLFPIPSLKTLESFVFKLYAADKQIAPNVLPRVAVDMDFNIHIHIHIF